MLYCHRRITFFFFFNDTATTEIYTLSLHDALPIFQLDLERKRLENELLKRKIELLDRSQEYRCCPDDDAEAPRSEEHTSELQSPCNLVCRLLLEKKKKPCKSRTASSRIQVQLESLT